MKAVLPWPGSFFCMPSLLKKVVWRLHGLYWGNLVTTMTSSLGMISLQCQLKELLIKYACFALWLIYKYFNVNITYLSMSLSCSNLSILISIIVLPMDSGIVNTNLVYHCVFMLKLNLFYFWCLLKPFMVSGFRWFCCCVIIIYLVHSLAHLCH